MHIFAGEGFTAGAFPEKGGRLSLEALERLQGQPQERSWAERNNKSSGVGSGLELARGERENPPTRAGLPIELAAGQANRRRAPFPQDRRSVPALEIPRSLFHRLS